ncbi:MAG: hypothetical protein KDE27_32625 [Planctomycetes bacterium]|nr:hypothetical protein [Planctomycetota bacterium]
MSRQPRVEPILRRLFWRLMMRGRNAWQANEGRRRHQMSLKLTLLIYGCFGLIPGLTTFKFPPLPFATITHVMTLTFASLTLAVAAGSLLFARDETEILLHRPLHGGQILRAKVAVLIGYALLLALALNLAPLIAGMFGTGLDWRFLPAHLLSTALLMVFSVGATVLVYNLCLRWFGREKLDNLLALTQTLLTIVMVVGGQLAPRALQLDSFVTFDASSGWALALPPVWFAALDVLLCGAEPAGQVWLPAALAVVATGAVAWFAFDLLGNSYGEGLQALGEGGSTGGERAAGADRERRLDRLIRSRPLRGWLRDPLERQGFLLAAAYLLRDRETKTRVFPGIAPLVVMPLLVAFAPTRGGMSPFLGAMALAYLAIVPLQPLVMLQHTDQFRAADIVRAAPLVHWAPLYHGARKAVIALLVVPSATLLTGLMIAITGSWDVLLVAVPVLAVLPVYSFVPGLVRPWLPLSEPIEAVAETSLGCMVAMLTIGSAFVVAAVASVAASHGYAWPFAAGAVALSLVLQHTFKHTMLARRWMPSRR